MSLVKKIDLRLLKIIRSVTGKSKLVDFLVRFAATWLFYLLLLLCVISLQETASIGEARDAVRVFAITLVAFLVAETISWLIGYFFYRERPFARLKFRPLVWMPAKWKSFPSDHTTIGLTIGCSFLFLGHPLGPVLVVFGLIVGVARVAAGVHYPSDVFAGAVLAVLASYLTVFLLRGLPLA